MYLNKINSPELIEIVWLTVTLDVFKYYFK